MYAAHFGLHTLPFENTPDPAFFFDQGQYNFVLSTITDSVAAGRGLMIVAGPIGAGKTTLSHKLMDELPEKTKVIWLAEPPATADDLVLFIAQALEITSSYKSRLFIIRDIGTRLLGLRAEGRQCLIVIDESHLMTEEVFEGIRILTNLEQGAAKLLQVILLGQLELADQLARTELISLRQRVASLKILGKMKPERVREYILHRLEVAGCRRSLFSDQVLEIISHLSGGIPRVTNSLCHGALRAAYDLDKRIVEPEDVKEAALELGLGPDFFRCMDRILPKGPFKEPLNPGLDERPDHMTMEPILDPMGRSQPKEKREAGMFWPLILLLLSLVSLIASLWYYNSSG